VNGRQLRAILAVVRTLDSEELDRFVLSLPREFADLAIRLCNVSGQFLQGPLTDFLEGSKHPTGVEAEERFLDHLLKLDALTRVAVERHPVQQRNLIDDRHTVCPN
jgi:hypothetical protein